MALKFNSGKFTVLQVSDPQDMKYVRPAMVKMLNNAYDAVKPDLVLFTGDNILGNHLLDARIGNRQIASGKEATLKVMRESIDNIAAPLQRRGIPFALCRVRVLEHLDGRGVEEAARALSGDSGANEAIVKRYGELFD